MITKMSQILEVLIRICLIPDSIANSSLNSNTKLLSNVSDIIVEFKG